MSFPNLSVRPFLLFSLFLAGPAFAEIMVPPAGLNNGDQYRLFFMTSGERDATSTNIEDYNAFVQQHAESSPNLAALGLEWKAVASTPTVAARDNTGTNPELDGEGVPIYLVDGTLFEDSNFGLWGDKGQTQVHVTELGELFPFENPDRPEDILVWTGSFPDGTIGGNESLGTREPIVGFATGGGSLVFFNSDDDAPELHHLLAMSSVLTVPEPEFSILWLVFIFFAGQTHWRLRAVSSSEWHCWRLRWPTKNGHGRFTPWPSCR